MKHKSRFLLPILTFLTFGMVTGSIVAGNFVKEEQAAKEADAIYKPGASKRNVYCNLGNVSSKWFVGGGVLTLSIFGDDYYGGGNAWVGTQSGDVVSNISVLGASDAHIYVCSTGSEWTFKSCKFLRTNSARNETWATVTDDNNQDNKICKKLSDNSDSRNVFIVNDPGWDRYDFWDGYWNSAAYNIYTCRMTDNNQGSGSKIWNEAKDDSIGSGSFGYVFRHITYYLEAGTPAPGYEFDYWSLNNAGYATISDIHDPEATITGVSDDTVVYANYKKVTDNGVYITGEPNSWSTTTGIVGPATYELKSSHEHYFWEDLSLLKEKRYCAVRIWDATTTWYNPATANSSISVDVWKQVTVNTYKNGNVYEIYPGQNITCDLEIDANDKYYMFKTRPEDFKVTIGSTTRAANSRTDLYDGTDTTQFNFTSFPVTTLTAFSIEVHGITVPQSDINEISGSNMVKINNQWYIKKSAAGASITIKMNQSDGSYNVLISGAPASNDYFLLKNNSYSSVYETTYDSSLNDGNGAYAYSYLTLDANDTLKLYNAYDGTIVNYTAKNPSSTGDFSITASVLTCNTAGTYYFEVQRVSDSTGNFTKIFVDKKFFSFSFNANGKSASNMPTNQSVERLHKASTPSSTPTCLDAIFVKWCKESECENAWVFNTDIVSKDTVVYAEWDNISLTRVFVGGSKYGIKYSIPTKYDSLYDTILYSAPDAALVNPTYPEEPVAIAKSSITPAEGNRSFAIPVNGAHMSQIITVTIMNGNEEVYTFTETIQEAVASQISSDPFTTTANADNMLKAALTYGTYTQLYFGIDTSHLANSDITAADKTRILTAMNNEAFVNVPIASPTKTGTPTFTVRGVAFGSNDGFVIRIRLGKLVGNPTTNYSVAAGTNHVAGNVQTSLVYDEIHGDYCVEVKNITATQINSIAEVVITESSTGATRTLQYSVGTYLYTVDQTEAYKSDVALYNLCKAVNMLRKVSVVD